MQTFLGFWTLFEKEVMRFWSVFLQTVVAPIVTALLYLVIFAHVLDGHVATYHNVAYAAFILPGLIMMSVLQNAFANSSSSLILSKVTGNIVFMLLAPLSPLSIFFAYVLASVVRGVVVAIGMLLVTCWFIHVSVVNLVWILIFLFLATTVMGIMGLIAGLWAEKFDEIATVQNFLIMPATFLAGIFYSTSSLSPFWQMVSRVNPFFYMVDGFRYGFFGVSDVSPWQSLIVVSLTTLILSVFALCLLWTGYRLRK